jgi:hypothetical protein
MISSEERNVLQWDMGTVETRSEWYDGRRVAKARIKAEAEAAERGEILPPLVNSSQAMQIHLAAMEAKRVRQQRQAADSVSSFMNVAAGILDSPADCTSGIVARSVNAVADMHC